LRALLRLLLPYFLPVIRGRMEEGESPTNDLSRDEIMI